MTCPCWTIGSCRRTRTRRSGCSSASPHHHRWPEASINIAILLLLLALLVGGIGLFVEALRWFLIVAIVPALLSAVTGARGRRTLEGTVRPTPSAGVASVDAHDAVPDREDQRLGP